MFGPQPGINVYNQGIAGDLYQQLQYGSTQQISNVPKVWDLLQGVKAPMMHGPGARRHLNGLSILISFVMPCAIFAITIYLMSFYMHYMYPNLTYLLCAAVLAVPVAFGVLALNARRKKEEGLSVEPTWFLFLFGTCLLAWCAGFLLGHYNYAKNMNAFFDRKNLRRALYIDPGQQRGQQLMDAGEVFFQAGAHVETKLSYAYKKTDTYCVAPIVSGDNSKLGGYDFWAVGVNCCFTQGDFSCGNMFDPKVRGGLRWWGDDSQQMFSMAVGQAEAKYGIKANHPLFFTWTENPTRDVNALLRAAWKLVLSAFFFFMIVQGILVGTATLWYSRLHKVQTPANAAHHAI